MTNFNERMAALIMLGGKSRRMGGGIKSLIEFNKKNIFERILQRTESQIKKIIINSNEKEIKLEKYKIPIIKDIKKGYLGPLAGIHSAMKWIIINEPRIEWLVTLPGDTPFIPKNLVSCFQKKISSNNKIILAKSNNKIFPTIGCWHISLYKNLDCELDKGVRKIMTWAELHSMDFINFKFDKYDPFFNINNIEDIEIAAKIEKYFL